jgi:dTDP-4-amino-4,6-dideoxygalactose transaminase
VEQRRAVYQQYFDRYSGHPGISFLNEPEGYYSNRWLTAVIIDPKQAGITRETLRLALEAENIESRPLWKPMHVQPVFAQAPFYGDGCSEQLFENGLCLPSGSSLTQGEMDRIFGVLDAVLQHELTSVGGG